LGEDLLKHGITVNVSPDVAVHATTPQAKDGSHTLGLESAATTGVIVRSLESFFLFIWGVQARIDIFEV
jgi:hypothetical protein